MGSNNESSSGGRATENEAHALVAEQAQRRSQAMIDTATAALPVTFTTFDVT